MGETQKKEKKKIGLTTKIFIALLAGAVFGIILCYAVPSRPLLLEPDNTGVRKLL